ncbi:hypothetical protein K490DRAFT_15740, partial [Saccharata proteae CBS 121410]
FSWLDYSIFLLLGVAMLWAWNMFLAAGPYFQRRFESSPSILRSFQSAELSVSTVVNLVSMLLLAKLQAHASYPKRIMVALVVNIFTFSLLAISTRHFLSASATAYLVFMMITVALASLGTALCQNGVFAYVNGFGREEYTQAIMVGQGVAGVLPCIAQIVSVLSISKGDAGEADGGEVAQESGKAAFAYFLTATAVSGITLAAFAYLLHRRSAIDGSKSLIDSINDLRGTNHTTSEDNTDDATPIDRANVPLATLLRKLFWLAAAVFLTFFATMMFPVFTQRILSTHHPSASGSLPALLRPAAFIPLAFLVWNSGDLLGRLLPAIPPLSLVHRPRLVFALSLARCAFVPLYVLCNISGRGAMIGGVGGDVFYLAIVQFGFGVTNGFVGSTCMMGAGEWVEKEEREAAGGFMGLSLVAGLAAGSVASFLVGG